MSAEVPRLTAVIAAARDEILCEIRGIRAELGKLQDTSAQIEAGLAQLRSFTDGDGAA